MSFDKVMDQITSEISDEFPEIGLILERASGGEITDEQALAEMMRYTNANPEIANRIANIFLENAKQEEEVMETDSEIFVMPKQYPTKSVDNDNSLKPSLYDKIWEDRSEQGKIARFNPQYEGYLAERLQFDGDAPELRTSTMDKDTVPAVDVVAISRNPIVVGDQLRKASDQVRAEQDKLEEEYTKKISGQIESTELVKPNTELDRSQIPQPVGYESGKLPVPRNVEEMSSDELLCLSKDIKRENIWKVLSTTQGRRSVSSVIANMVVERLAEYNIDVVLDDNAEGRVVSSAYWTCLIKSSREIQDQFSLLETAAFSIAYNVKRNMKEDVDPNKTLYLSVRSVNEYSVREVGWGARLIEND